MMKTANKSFGTFLRSFVCATFLVAICLSTEASAKRGCSAFGHSCFGGHGKRSEPSTRAEESLQDVENLSQDIQDYDTPRGGEEVLIADGGQIYQDRPMPRFHRLQALSPQQQQHPAHNLSPFIRQWLASYRRANPVDFGTM